ncbi:MAG: YoaK family protein [Opitutaceae bacterium]
MIAKLPRWAWIGGSLLAGIAGMVNAVGFLSYAHQAVTHLTGTTTLLALAIVQQRSEVLHLCAVIGSFVAGAALSGFAIEHSMLRLGRRYGAVLFVESMLLAGAAALMASRPAFGSYLASAACGLQNAMASSYSGTVLRTAHLTGMFTDFGVGLGHWLRRVETDWKRLRLCANLIASFAVGGALGAMLFRRFGTQTLYIPAALTGVVAIAYSGYAHFNGGKSAS